MKKITKQVLYSLLFLAMLIGNTINTNAQCNIKNDTEVTNGSNISSVINNNYNSTPFYILTYTFAQTFTASCTGKLNKLGLYFFQKKGTFTRIAIYDGETTSGSPVELTNFPSTDFTSDSSISTFFYFADISSLNKIVTAGQKYTIVFDMPVPANNTDVDNFIGIGLANKTSYPYSGGSIISPSGYSDRDLAFLIDVTAIPKPTLTSTDAASIAVTSASLGGDITNDNGHTVTERGVVYSSINTSPEIGDANVTKETNGSGIGVFNETITGLSKNTTYYFSAYATSASGTAYGAVKSFTTLNDEPVLTTTDASSVFKNTATLGGNISSDGGSTITERGVVYSSTDQTPEIGESNVTKNDEGGTTTGVFSEITTGLTPSTTYYFRAYATNANGTTYSTVKTFTTTKDFPEIVSIVRQNPVAQNLSTSTTSAIFRITFDKAVNNVDATDFSTNSTGATINNVSAVSTSIYDVTVNNITALGTIYLQVKGINSVSGSNNITYTTPSVTSQTTTVDQQTTNDYLNQASIGQTFKASNSGIVKSVTFYPENGQHTFSGTADLKLYSGTSNSGGTEIDSEQVSITSSTASTGQTFSFTTPVTLTAGNTYTILLDNFSGSGSWALESNTAGGYNDGHVIFTGMNGSSHLNFDLKIKIIEEHSATEELALADKVPSTNENFIKTDPTGKAIITTTDATTITATSATLGGEITTEGNSAVTERGIVYATTSSFPKIGGNGVTKNDNGAGTGTFSEAISGLDTKNIYFYRAYATNSSGTSYGAVKKFSLNNALHLDGTDIAEVPNYNYTNGFSMDALLKPDVVNTTQTFLSRYSSNNEVFAFIIKSDGTVECTVTTDGSSDTYFTTTATLTAGVWQHIAFTYNNADGAMKFYINGTDAGGSGSVTNATTGALFNTNENIQIGARDGTLEYQGAIDELRIWNKTLSEPVITQIKNKVIPVTADGLLAYYQFNQGIAAGNNTSITQLFNKKTTALESNLSFFTKTGTTSNFIAGASGNFNNNTVAQNSFMATGNWSDPTKWSLGKVPSQIENAFIDENQTVTVDVNDLVMDNFELTTGATLNIPADKEITVNNSFISSGSLTLGSSTTNSGVLLVNGTTSGNVTYIRGGLLANKWSIITPPVSGQKIKAFAENATNNIRKRTDLTPNKYAIAFYDDTQPSGQKWVYYFADMDANLEFEVGKSYIISRATDGEVSFTGALTTESISKTLTTDQWSAIGNPFTTYFPANKNGSSSFLNDNLSSLDDTYQSIYVWDNTQNKYVVVSEVDDNNRSLTPGQGFFVKLKNGQTNITFNEAKRTTKPATGNNNFGKTKNITPSINLKLSDNEHSVNTTIKYFDKATIGFDKGYDIGNFNSIGLDIYSRLVDASNNTNFTIQSLPKDNYENMIIPIGVKSAANKEIIFSLVKKNIPDTYKIFLEDKETKSFTQLDVDNASYKITFTEDTNTTDRFNLHVTPQVLSVDEISSNNLNIFLSQNRTLNIVGYNFSNKATLKVITLLGQEIISRTIKNNTIQLPNTLKTGIYIVKLNSDSGSLTKKIILE